MRAESQDMYVLGTIGEEGRRLSIESGGADEDEGWGEVSQVIKALKQNSLKAHLELSL